MKVQKNKFYCKRDNYIIRRYEYKTDGDKKPVAIVSHGFMANQGTVKHYAKFLAELGFAAYCYDFCGGYVIMGKSDGKTTDMSVLTEVKDLIAVIEYAGNLQYTDESNILLMGCSQGGFVSAITASKLKDKIKKLALFYPALCIPDDARSGQMMFAKFEPKNIPEIVPCGSMKLGKCYVEAVVGMNPYEEIKDYENDVMIVHGTADKIVDIKYTKEAIAVYEEKADRVVKYYEIDGGAHMFSKKHDKIAMQYIEQFVDSV